MIIILLKSVLTLVLLCNILLVENVNENNQTKKVKYPKDIVY